MVWQCPSKQIMQDGSWDRGDERSEYGIPIHIDSTLCNYDTWNSLVRYYSGCGLTKRSDKLPALSGIAQKFWSHLKDDYYAGTLSNSSFCQLPHIVFELIKWSANVRLLVERSLARLATIFPVVETIE